VNSKTAQGLLLLSSSKLFTGSELLAVAKMTSLENTHGHAEHFPHSDGKVNPALHPADDTEAQHVAADGFWSSKKSGSVSEESSNAYLADIGDEQQRRTIASNRVFSSLHKLGHNLQRFNIEKVGITPLPESQRTYRKWWTVGLLWFPCNFNVLSFSAGTLVTEFGLGIYGAMFSILGFTLVCSFFPAYVTTWGPKIGLRQMVTTRFSWGYFPTMLLCVFNAASMMGYSILNSILGGQTLSAVSGSENLTPTVGIVIVSVISLGLSFCGIKILNWVERWFWIPILVAFITLVSVAGTGTEGLHVPAGPDPSSARGILSMGAVIAGFLVSYTGLAMDMTHYLHPSTPSWKLFTVTYLGFFLATAPVFMLGAGFAIAAQENQAWADALGVSNGALFDLILGNDPNGGTALRGFGKFCTVLFALSVIPNIMLTFYSFGLTFSECISFERAQCTDSDHITSSNSHNAPLPDTLPTLHLADPRNRHRPATRHRRRLALLHHALKLHCNNRVCGEYVRRRSPRRPSHHPPRRFLDVRPRNLE
jgi:purine-cytosine permease-like protein